VATLTAYPTSLAYGKLFAIDTISAAPAAPSTPLTTRDDPTIWRVDDALWAELRPLLLVHKPRKKPGAPRKNDRPIFDGLIWLARTGSQWAALPHEFGAKSTAHDRLKEWVAYGCLQAAWAHLLHVYDDEIGLEWEWQSADGCIIKAPLGKKGGLEKRRRPAPTPPTAANVAASAIS